ncbi:hypothetical protein DPMN_175762 [Dreissena polymorpha]|uniref:Uncharacterized protein n=1 Tax=Dreissena polymorpha TaxID=45954 RepID=A0A9D4IHI6_DREPO|nr:hypothetical protein DPMN_175762 [Dreissena polymorpha]
MLLPVATVSSPSQVVTEPSPTTSRDDQREVLATIENVENMPEIVSPAFQLLRVPLAKPKKQRNNCAMYCQRRFLVKRQ